MSDRQQYFNRLAKLTLHCLYIYKCINSFPRLKNVPIPFKVATTGVILVLNAAALYRIYSMATTYDNELKFIVVVVCVAEWLCYGIVVETLIAGLIAYGLPRMVSSEVRGAVATLKQCAQRMFSADKYYDDIHILNAPDFLYMSNKLARKNTHLFESSVIFSYRTFLPGKYAELWTRVMSPPSEKRSFLSRLCTAGNYLSVSFLCRAALMRLACWPESFQRVVLHILLCALPCMAVALYYVTVLFPWIVLGVVGFVLLEIRARRGPLDDCESGLPLDDSKMIDQRLLQECFPPPSPRVFTVEHNKSKRLDKMVEALTPPPQDPPERGWDVNKDGSGEGLVPCSGLGTSAPPVPSTPIKPIVKKDTQVEDSTPVPPVHTPIRERQMDVDAARIALSAEKLNRLYSKTNRRFRAMTDMVSDLQSTLATVVSHMNELNVAADKHMCREDNEKELIDEGDEIAAGGGRSDDKNIEASQQQHGPCELVVPLCDEKEGSATPDTQERIELPFADDKGDDHDSDRSHGSTSCCDKQHVVNLPMDQGESGVDTPPRIHVLQGNKEVGVPGEIVEDSFNLLPARTVRMTCGSPLIVPETNAFPVVATPSYETKTAWLEQKKSLKIRRNLILGKDGLDGVSISEDVALAELRENRKQGRKSPIGNSSPITLSPIARQTTRSKRKKDRHNTSKKVVPES